MSKRISDAEENAILAKLETVDPDVLEDALSNIEAALENPGSEMREQVIYIVNALARIGLEVS